MSRLRTHFLLLKSREAIRASNDDLGLMKDFELLFLGVLVITRMWDLCGLEVFKIHSFLVILIEDGQLKLLRLDVVREILTEEDDALPIISLNGNLFSLLQILLSLIFVHLRVV